MRRRSHDVVERVFTAAAAAGDGEVNHGSIIQRRGRAMRRGRIFGGSDVMRMGMKVETLVEWSSEIKYKDVRGMI